MAEVATDPGERGRLDVRTKALQQIVEQVVLEVRGTVERRSGLGTLVRRSTLGAVTDSDTPHASVSVTGGRARVRVDVACAWPAPVTRIAQDVRRRVLERAAELSGIEVVSVDVSVSTVAPVADDQPGRVA